MPTLNAEKAIYKPCLFYYVLENCLLYKKSLNKIFKKNYHIKMQGLCLKQVKNLTKKLMHFVLKKILADIFIGQKLKK